MLCEQIIAPDFPTLTTSGTVGDAMLIFEDHNLNALPLLQGEHLMGLLSLEVLQTLDERNSLDSVVVRNISIGSDQHIYIALNTLTQANTGLLPVLDQQQRYLGVITDASILSGLATMLDVHKSGGAILTIQMKKLDYSLSQLTRLIESGDANIMQLNTYTDMETENIWVNIRLDRMEISDIVSTLQRYEFNVVHFWGNEMYENELRRNYEALLNYLSI
ncbi:CBS domain-containing protein [Arachidicoccus rhizosphaerae]|uniref:CBS domain-containing protein n=1 Tax=Arachidicoccus rhizosphaerae TaxID=551991 RepID=A0A1H4C0Y2_9BACT|nr:CBS domain-containing protein [Arachidicoccus rhizosphaerae]SEA54036.1 CBS domain-containing protein [Arachidicoccus rhizosphaerae]